MTNDFRDINERSLVLTDLLDGRKRLRAKIASRNLGDRLTKKVGSQVLLPQRAAQIAYLLGLEPQEIESSEGYNSFEHTNYIHQIEELYSSNRRKYSFWL